MSELFNRSILQMRKTLLCIFGFGLVLVVASWLAFDRWASQRIAHSKMIGENFSRIQQLRLRINYAAAVNPSTFKSLISESTTIDAPEIPPEIQAEFYEPYSGDPHLWDIWGRALKVQVSVIPGPGDSPQYFLRIWSTGANGVDENGRGDDIASENSVLQLEPQ